MKIICCIEIPKCSKYVNVLLKIGGGELLTFSICPECYSDFFEKYTNKFSELKIDEYRRLLSENIKIIEAKIFEENGKMYMFKECKEHGEFKDYLGLSELYYRAKKYDLLGKGAITPKNKEKYKCPFDCGPCVNHKSHTVLAIIDVTNRCNMACPICFASSGKPEYIYEPSYSDIKRMVTEAIRNGAVALQNSGGEPTVRDDLDKIIRIERSTGIHHIEVDTNGLRIAMEGPKYARKLVESGVDNFYLQFDAVGEDGDEVYQKLRGRKLWKVKEECIENLREGGCRSVTLVVTFSKEINGKELGKVIKFAEENPDWDVVLVTEVKALEKACSIPEADNLTVMNAGDFSEEEKIEMFVDAGVFCFPTRQDSQGLVLCEAQAMGVPTCYTGLPQQQEVGGGVEIPYKSIETFPDGMRLAIIDYKDVEASIYKTYEHAEFISEYGRENAKRFRASVVAKALVELLES